MHTPPPHVADALLGRRADHVAPAPAAHAPWLLLTMGSAFAAAGVLVATLAHGGAPFTLTVAGLEHEMTGRERGLLVAGASLLAGLPAAYLLALAARTMEERHAWVALTDEGVLVMSQTRTRLEPWSGFSLATLRGPDVHLAAKVGLRHPAGRMVPGGADPARIRDLCHARIRGAAPGPDASPTLDA